MDVRRIPISKIKPAPYNPRKELKPGDYEYEALKRSMHEFGTVEPLVWNKRTGHLVGGHQRLSVLKADGAAHADVSVVDLPREKEKALNIALNKIQGDWDQDKLAELLSELTKIPDFDIAVTGFEQDETRDLIAEVLGLDADGAMLQAEAFDLATALKDAGPPVTRPGDLIVFGKDPKAQHRLLCGDSTNPDDVRRLMNGRRAVLFATDPPYLVGYDGTNHPAGVHVRKKRSSNKDGKPRPMAALAASGGVEKSGGEGGLRGLAIRRGKNKDWSPSYGTTWDDADANPELYDKFIAAAIAEALSPSAAWYCWHASKRHAMLEAAWEKHGVLPHCQIIWAKNRPVLTRTWYAWQHEPCLMGWLKGNKPARVENKVLSTVWNLDTIPNGPDRPDHPTPKPLEVFEIPMRQHTRPRAPENICYEPFAGSGTQFIAAQRLGRRCFGMEISPLYCDVIIRRMIAFAGEGCVTPEVAKRYRVTKDASNNHARASGPHSTRRKGAAA